MGTKVAAAPPAALAAAYAAHPERFVRGPAKAVHPPALVAINPLEPGVRLLTGVHLLTEGGR